MLELQSGWLKGMRLLSDPLPSQPEASAVVLIERGEVLPRLVKVRSQPQFRCTGLKGGLMTSSRAPLVDNEVSFSLAMGVTKSW